jgi:hypothetical protein
VVRAAGLTALAIKVAASPNANPAATTPAKVAITVFHTTRA